MKSHAWSGLILALFAVGPANATQFEITSPSKGEVKPADMPLITATPKSTASVCTYDRWGKWVGWISGNGFCTAGPDGEGSCVSDDGGSVWSEPMPSDC